MKFLISLLIFTLSLQAQSFYDFNATRIDGKNISVHLLKDLPGIDF